MAKSKAAVTGTATVISIGGVTGATGTETFVALAEVSDAKFSGRKRGVVMTTNFDSANVARKLGTVLDYGQFTCTVNRLVSDPGQMAIIAANASGLAYDFKVQLPVDVQLGQTTTGDLITFSGIVTDAGDFDISLTKQSDFSFTIDIDGAYTVAAGS